MFSNLIESGSHTRDLKRRGKFFIGALACYGLLVATVGVGSIYAYNTHLDEQHNFYLVTLIRFPTAAPRSEPVKRDTPKPGAGADSRPQMAAKRPEISLQTPYHGDKIAKETTKEVNARTPVEISSITSDPHAFGGPIGPVKPGGSVFSDGDGTEGPVVKDGEAAPLPPVKVTPTPEPRRHTGPLRLPSAIIAGKATYKPAPPYPTIAKQIKQQGSVSVQIVVDEQGRVISAKATSGPPLLLQAAEQAASQARFSPTTLNGQPVKISGVITYNFVLQ